jgi:glyoxalase family protein
MANPLLGIHHITAIAGDPQGNLDFYSGVLGLRLVKRTVNFDDPETYHLYYGDEVGHPGTILTFFPWPNAPRGRRGAGQATVIAFSISPDSLGYWMERLKAFKIPFDAPVKRFDEEVLPLTDPDGLQLELVTDPVAGQRNAWENGPVQPQNAIRGFYGLTLTERSFDATSQLLVDVMGFRPVDESGNRCRFNIGDHPRDQAMIDILAQPDASRGQVAVGTVHHVAWRTSDDEAQLAWRSDLAGRGINVTQVMDRQYFHSIYYREPGGVLFEIATDPPGFTTDETTVELGTTLKLPPWLEPP